MVAAGFAGAVEPGLLGTDETGIAFNPVCMAVILSGVRSALVTVTWFPTCLGTEGVAGTGEIAGFAADAGDLPSSEPETGVAGAAAAVDVAGRTVVWPVVGVEDRTEPAEGCPGAVTGVFEVVVTGLEFCSKFGT